MSDFLPRSIADDGRTAVFAIGAGVIIAGDFENGVFGTGWPGLRTRGTAEDEEHADTTSIAPISESNSLPDPILPFQNAQVYRARFVSLLIIVHQPQPA